MKKTILFAGLISTAFLLGCDGGNRAGEAEENEEVEVLTEAEEVEIILSPMVETPEFQDAILEQTEPGEEADLPAGPVTFQYNVKNFELTDMTEAMHADMIANSHKGQHIHLILNNRPYDAVYETTYEKELEEGHYVELSFLSRSFHMSLKHPEAYVLRQFTVGEPEEEEVEVDLNAPHMFYSRPKGTYTGEETKRIMLDFYLVNTELSEDGHKVRATINNDQEFMLTEWQPYALEGLPMGENTIKLELLDENGELVESPFNPVTRTITLEGGTTPAS